MWGHCFGKPGAVIHFHRPQRMLNAGGRRWLVLLLSFYYDDVTVQDLDIMEREGQGQFREFMKIMGLPLAPKKQVDMTESADYLGLDHYCADVAKKGVVSFTPRETISGRSKAMIGDMLRNGWAAPAMVGKLKGCAGVPNVRGLRRWGSGRSPCADNEAVCGQVAVHNRRAAGHGAEVCARGESALQEARGTSLG